MSRRTLVFIERASDAGGHDMSTDLVVLDTTWTPEGGTRPDLIPIRPELQAVITTVDLFDETLDRIDAWATAMRLPDRFMIGGVSWWNQVRIILRWDVHELMLWRLVLDGVAPAGRYGTIVIPSSRPVLLAAARAWSRQTGGPAIHVSGASVGRVRRSVRWLRRHTSPAVKSRVKDVIAAVRLGPRRWRELSVRRAVLSRRLDTLRAAPVDVFSIVSARILQPVRIDGRDRYVDPNLAFALDRLAADGSTIVSLAVAIDHRNETDWARLATDERVIPQSMIRDRYERPGDDHALGGAEVEGLGDATTAPFEVDGVDLAREVRSIVEGYTGPWLTGQRRWTVWAERLLEDLRPRVLFLDREDSRTPWTAAARRLGIPIVATQHGVIYPKNPAYYHQPHAGVLLPDLMCVCGPYERDVLTTQGLYEPDRVLVTGWGRPASTESAAAAAADAAADRAAVRHDLGIADGDRMLVVSVANNPVGGDIHSVCMVARMLDGPLPGVHVVVKLHPIDRQVGTYQALLGRLARAGGYPPIPVSVVRDIDLYRLLRAADAHLGQYSTVLTDAVVAGTPNMIAVGAAFNDHIGYEAARVATPVRSVDEVRAFMADPRLPDPGDRSRFLAAHFLPGDGAGRIAAAVSDAMLPARPSGAEDAVKPDPADDRAARLR